MIVPSRLRALAFLSFILVVLVSPAGVSLHARAAGLTGRVLDPDGRPVANAELIISGPTAAPLKIRTNSEGRFAVTLPDGRYSLVATSPGLISDVSTIDVGAAAQSIDLKLRLTALAEALVVSASQVDQPLSRTPDSVTVIPGRDIDARQQFTLGEVLRSVPGLTVQQNGGPGAVTSLFTRGGESDFTLVLIDGVRANAFGGGVDLSQVPLEDVERIEVVRGPQSALYGSDAIGGVIQIITRRGGTPAARAQAEAGSRDMRRASAATNGDANGVRWQAGGNYFEDRGFTGKAANGRTVTNDDAQERQASGSIGWRHAASGADVEGSVLYVDTDRGSPGPYGSDPAHRYAGIDTISRGTTARTGGGIRWVQPWFGASSRVRQRVEFDRAVYDLDFTSRFGTSASNTTRAHVRVQTDVAASSATGVSAGFEWLDESGRSTFITSGTGRTETPITRGVLGIFAEGRWHATDRATLTAGIRGERITRDALQGDPLAFQPRPDFPAETIASVNPKIAATLLIAGDPSKRSWTRARGAFGTGIRPPDAFEIAFTDNSGLKPERSRSGEVGVTQALAGGAIQIEATAFVNSYTDLIVSVGRALSGVSRYRTDNISNARARGAELAAAWRIAGAITIHTNYTFLDSEILAVNGSPLAPAPYHVGDALLRRPRHSGALDAAWSHRGLSAFAQLQVRGDALDAEPAFGPSGGLFTNPGHTVVNAGGSWQIARSVAVFARALNLFDRDYEEVLGYPAPGRSAYVGARFAVGR